MPLGTIISLCALVVFFVAYMVCRFLQKKIPSLILKGLASLCFVLAAIFTKDYVSIDNDVVYGLLIGAVSCGFVADVLIQFRRHYMKYESIFFNISFALYGIEIILLNLILVVITAHSENVESITWQTIAALAVTIVVIILFNIIAKKAKFEFNKYELQANLYLLVLSFVAFISIFLFISGNQQLLFMLGMIAFVISDIFLWIVYFANKEKNIIYVVLNNIFYYGAQILLVLSVIYTLGA